MENGIILAFIDGVKNSEEFNSSKEQMIIG
jgi:hypothetical protein